MVADPEHEGTAEDARFLYAYPLTRMEAKLAEALANAHAALDGTYCYLFVRRYI
jgi:hypothetical protein